MEEKLRQAHQLAYFILGEAEAAFRATREAVSALDVTLVRQDKRIHYQSSHRTKVSLGEWQLLQRLVYIAAEAEERRQEEQGVAEDTLVMHYIKHLVYITICRNSFFVALGLGRLLYNYTTPETAQIHELVVQDPNRGRDDSYYRRRKAQLMRELQARFGAMLNVQRGARGEERFQALPDAQGYLSWVKECLSEFTPWKTQCIKMPAAFDPYTDELPLLRFSGGDPDGEHEVEIRRFHALLHPDCFEQLLSALRLDAPAKRLEVPQFKLRKPPAPPHGGQPPTAQLSEEKMQNLKESVMQESERRRRFTPTWLRIVVDGVERARWSLEQSPHGQIEIAFSDKFIEVYGSTDGEDLRLATHLLSYDIDDHLQPLAAALTLEGGQQLRFHIEPLPAADEEDAGAIVVVSYRETAPLRALRWWWHQLRRRYFNYVPPQFWKPALAFILVALFVAIFSSTLLFIRYLSPDKVVKKPTPVPQVPPTPAPTKAISPQPTPSTAPTQRPSVLRSDEVIAMDISTRGEAGEMLTRSQRVQAVGLLEAKKVYLEISGVQLEDVRQQLLQRLPADNQLSLTDNRGDADVALKVTVSAARQGRLALTVWLADANGKVIWPLTQGTIARKYEGSLEKVIAAFSRELASDLRR